MNSLECQGWPHCGQVAHSPNYPHCPHSPSMHTSLVLRHWSWSLISTTDVTPLVPLPTLLLLFSDRDQQASQSHLTGTMWLLEL